MNLECPGCKLKSRVALRMPALFSPTITSYTCGHCGSDVFAKLVRAKSVENPHPHAVKVTTRILHPSPLLQQMQREEAEHNAKEPYAEDVQP